MTRVVLVPGVLALLPEYAGIEDPVAELRAACLQAVAWLGADVRVIADGNGARIAAYLLGSRSNSAIAPDGQGGGAGDRPNSAIARDGQGGGAGDRPNSAIARDGQGGDAGDRSNSAIARDGQSYLVVANGSAKRTEKAPGHLDERAQAFDDALGAALRAGDLSDVDLSLAAELWASVDAIDDLRGLLHGEPATVDYDDDPFGVQYWVMRWECAF